MLAMAIVSTNVEAPIASAALFKNGYAVVIREIKVGPTGEYLLPKLPQSSFGTLWFATSNGLKLALTAAVVGILFVGLVPSPLMDAAKDAAAVFVQ